VREEGLSDKLVATENSFSHRRVTLSSSSVSISAEHTALSDLKILCRDDQWMSTAAVCAASTEAQSWTEKPTQFAPQMSDHSSHMGLLREHVNGSRADDNENSTPTKQQNGVYLSHCMPPTCNCCVPQCDSRSAYEPARRVHALCPSCVRWGEEQTTCFRLLCVRDFV